MLPNFAQSIEFKSFFALLVQRQIQHTGVLKAMVHISLSKNYRCHGLMTKCFGVFLYPKNEVAYECL
jgi:hypothetical protein